MRSVRVLTVVAILLGLFALPAMATTDIEVCRDGQPITIPVDQLLETDERIWDDFDRADCQPPRIPTPTTIPTVEIDGPVFSVGYVCPGTDGVVYELPWGTYDDMYLTPEQAASACPVGEIPALADVPVVVDPVDPVSTITEDTLPFTGVEDLGIGILAGLAMLGLGSLLVRSSRDD